MIIKNIELSISFISLNISNGLIQKCLLTILNVLRANFISLNSKISLFKNVCFKILNSL